MKSKLFRMDEKTFLELNIKLAKEGMSFQKLVEQAIQDFLDSYENVRGEK